ncbi:MAG TPA: hypothetical protein VGM39_03990 [Kofleriaceae bacterium]
MSKRWLVIGLLGAALVLAVVAVVMFARDHWNGIYDDTFIYLRYAKNIDAGCGPRFNCDGPLVEGFTSPLFLALLSLGSLLTRQLIELSQILCTASLIVALVLAGAVAMRLVEDVKLAALAALATVAVLALDHFVLLNSTTGMETALGAAFSTAIAYAAIQRRPWLLVALVGMALLVRPENMVYMVALPLLPELRRPKYLLTAVGIVIAIALARYAIFGVFAPNTYYAKSGGTWRHAELGLAYMRDAIIDFPLVIFAPLALLVEKHRRAVIYLLAGAAAWFLFFLRSGGDLFEYSRLWFPLVPMLSALALVGVGQVAVRLARARFVPVAVLALAVIVRARVAHTIPPQHTSPRVLEWAAVGTYLRAHYPKDALVATVPIGAIGYYSKLPILDLVGLTEPAIARAGRSVPEGSLTRLWIGHERNNTEYVLSRAPRVIVTTMTRDQPWTSLAEAKAGFYSDWLLLQEIKAGRAPYHVVDAEVFPHDHILMFERN